jgi:hypothetical protein
VFFTDEKPLTSDSTAEASAPDLYEYDFEKPEGQRLTDLTSRTSNPGEHADVAGVLGASEDGAYVYFAAAGALPGTGAVHQECRPSGAVEPENKCNLYALHEGEPPKLIVTLPASDGGGAGEQILPVLEWAAGQKAQDGDWERSLADRSAHISAVGSELVFESSGDLTGFDSEGNLETYIYNFSSGVSCVSCNPTGRPTLPKTELHDRFKVSDFTSAELPESRENTYALRDISADGDRVFFESNEALTPGVATAGIPLGPLSIFGLTNVFEWEREGAGSCAAKVPARIAGGCIFLLTEGTSSDLAFFLDASENGEDVFIATRAQLVGQDHGETFEVYDAHECTMASPCLHVAATACTGAGCQGVPPAPPIFATPSSATITGVDDLEPPPPAAPAKKVIKKKTIKCPRGKKSSKGKCTKAKGKKTKAKKSVHINRKAK